MIENIDHRSGPALACSSARRTRCSSPNDERTDDLATDSELTEAIVEVAAELALFASDLHRVPAALAGELPAAYLSITHLDAEIESRIYERLVADLIEDASFPSYAIDHVVIGCDGIARISELGLAEARGIAIPGITPYTAPRPNQPPDARADVFALGAIAWSALTGHVLFAGHDEAGTRERLLHLPVPAPSEVGARPPCAWNAVVLRALARNPDDRFASANALGATETATHAEVGLWVESTFAKAFARRRTRATELDPGEMEVCRLRGEGRRTRT
jgi:serine/threonine protein kinase